MQAVSSVMSSLHRERLSIRVDNVSYAVPAWADWLIWLGTWMRSQAIVNGRRVTVVLLPTRRLAAAFVGFGAMMAASHLHDDALDWKTLLSLPIGTPVHWRIKKGGKTVACAGTVDGIRDVSGSQLLAIVAQSPAKFKGVTYFLSQTSALDYGVTRGAVTRRGEDALTRTTALLQEVVDNSSEAWVRSPMADSTLITERSTFLADLEGISIAAGSASPGTALLDALTIADPVARQHGKLRLVPIRDQGIDDISGGTTILDGGRAAMQLGQCSARSVVILLDHADFDEELNSILNRFLDYSIDDGAHADTGLNTVIPPPSWVDVLAFALSEDQLVLEGGN